MGKIVAWIKAHPVETGVLALVGGIIALLLLRGGSSSSSASSGPGQVAALTLQEQQLQAATGLQESQVAAQTAQTQYQAQVANTQTSAALNAQNFQTEAALVADLSGNQSNLAGLNIEANTTNQVNQEQYQLAHQYIGTQANLEGQYLTDQNSITNSVLGDVKDINGSQNRLALLLSALGNSQGSIAAVNDQTISSGQGNALIGNLTNTAVGGVSGILKTLFG